MIRPRKYTLYGFINCGKKGQKHWNECWSLQYDNTYSHCEGAGFIIYPQCFSSSLSLFDVLEQESVCAELDSLWIMFLIYPFWTLSAPSVRTLLSQPAPRWVGKNWGKFKLIFQTAFISGTRVVGKMQESHRFSRRNVFFVFFLFVFFSAKPDLLGERMK